MKYKIDGYLVILLFLAIILCGLLIYTRVQIANKNQELPNYIPYGDTNAIYKEPSFYADELTYYNFSPELGLIQALTQRIFAFFNEGSISNINLYGYYVYLIKLLFIKNDRFWWILFFFTGFPAYLLFVYLIYYILRNIFEISSRTAFLLNLMLMISPVALIHGASWLRDMLIYDFMLLAIIFAIKRIFAGFLIATIVQTLLRGYMLIPHILIFMLFWPKETLSFKDVIKKSFIGIVLTFSLLLWIIVKSSGLNRLINEFPLRFIEAVSGLSFYLVTGRFIPRMSIYSILYDFNMFGYYYIVFLYFLIYFRLFLKILMGLHFSDLEKRYWSLFILVVLTLTMLHAGALGFFVPRIIFIFQILAFLAFSAMLSPLKNKTNQKIFPENFSVKSNKQVSISGG